MNNISDSQPPAPEEQQKIKNEASWVELLKSEIGRVIVGQKYLIDRLIVGLLANGHVLLEGVPGLAKTLAVKTLSQCLRADFKRIQPNSEGFRVMHFDAKKTTARQVPFDQDAYDAIEAYQRKINAKDEDVVFPPGQSRDPTNKYV